MPNDPGVEHRFLYYKLDPELKIIHLFKDCRGLKTPKKYGYMKEFHATTPEDMEYLDRLVEIKGYLACHVCWGREKAYSIRQNRRARPGFRTEPRIR